MSVTQAIGYTTDQIDQLIREHWQGWAEVAPDLCLVPDPLQLKRWLTDSDRRDADRILRGLAQLASVDGADSIEAAAVLAWLLVPAATLVAHHLGALHQDMDQLVAGQLWIEVRTSCRGIREVEAESVAYMVTQAHGLNSAQYTFNYVAGWASQVATSERGIDAVVAETGGRVITAADHILRHTHPGDLETSNVDAAALDVGIGAEPGVVSRQPSVAGEWEVVLGTLPGAQQRESLVPHPLGRAVQRSGPRY